MTETELRTVASEAAYSDDLVEMGRRVSASVVEVRTRGHGAGAGTVWTAAGTIITNHHVAPGERAEVVLPDGRELPATVTSRDSDNDLAALQVHATGLAAVQPGDARGLRPGDLVFAVGHPFGVRHALTAGVVTAALPQAPARGERELLRASLRLLPGNSGGPMVNAQGRVVGINAMVSGGLALAVPSHLVERLLAGRRQPRLLGVEARPIELPAAFAAAAGGGSERGVLVARIREGSPAAAAGLLTGDVLLALDGRLLTSPQTLLDALQASGDTALLRLLRGGVPRELTVDFAVNAELRAA